MIKSTNMQSVKIPPVNKLLKPLALGGSYFGADPWNEQRNNLWAALETAIEGGINHFDTATSYGNGQSERLLGDFFKNRKEELFLASKVEVDEISAEKMLGHIERSLINLQRDMIDLYYIHWPQKGKDMRPLMEGLELARQQGKIGAIGVSNFSVAQMEKVAEVGAIDVHQLGYNLLWRVAEKDIIPYCQQHNIAVMTYSSIAQGILAGKYSSRLQLDSSDQRNDVVYFNQTVWPHIYRAVEQLKLLAEKLERPLAHLAIRWVLNQPGIHTAVVGGSKPEQVTNNLAALEGDIPQEVFEKMTAISDSVIQHIPDLDNMYGYYP